MIEERNTSDSSSTTPEIQATCRECGDLAIDFCKKCGQEFCPTHRSKYNNRLCHNCISDSSLALQSEPLIDDEGKEHRGRHLKLIGEGWPNSIAAIRDMSEEELEAHIAELTVGVKKAQLTLDYTQILKSAAEFDLADRQQSKIRSLRERRNTIEKGALKLNGASHTGMNSKKRTKDPIQTLATQMNIDYETAKLLMKALGK